jgi:hypothetical protein
VSSAISFVLPVPEESDREAVREAVQNPEMRAALAKSISSGLAVPQEDVIVSEVLLLDRRLASAGRSARFLQQETSSLKLSARFTVKAPAGVDSAKVLTDRMSALGSSHSSESDRFSSALGPNIDAAAASSSDTGSTELSKLSEALKSSGVVVLAVEAPVVQEDISTTEMALESTEERVSQIPLVIVGVLLVLLPFVGICLCVVLLRRWNDKKKDVPSTNDIPKVEPLPLDAKHLWLSTDSAQDGASAAQDVDALKMAAHLAWQSSHRSSDNMCESNPVLLAVSAQSSPPASKGTMGSRDVVDSQLVVVRPRTPQAEPTMESAQRSVKAIACMKAGTPRAATSVRKDTHR